MTFLDDMLARHPSRPTAGSHRWYEPDLLLLPDYALALMLDELPGADPLPRADRCLYTADHFAPPSSCERAAILARSVRRARSAGFPVRLFEGICHQLLVEDSRCNPGRLVVGSDSHTTTAGALGALAFGFGSTDVWGALVHGVIALPPPRILPLRLRGRLPPDCAGSDLARELFRRLGPRRLAGAWLAVDDGDGELAMEDRLSFCNLMTEAGVACAVIRPDETCRAWLAARDGRSFVEFPIPAALRPGEAEEIVLDGLVPLVSLPHDPFSVVPLDEAPPTDVDQIYVGSCASGRPGDLRRVLEGLGDASVASGLKALVTPSSRAVWLAASEAGLLHALVRRGAVILNPSCGPCGAIDKGLLAPGECCAATLNRNYRGRMGSPEARIVLVSPLVAGAAMRLGRLPGREELIPS